MKVRMQIKEIIFIQASFPNGNYLIGEVVQDDYELFK